MCLSILCIEFEKTGDVEPAFLLEQIELQIAKVKEEAFSRNDVLEKIEKWLAACEEESWLEEYNMVWVFLFFSIVITFAFFTLFTCNTLLKMSPRCLF